MKKLYIKVKGRLKAFIVLLIYGYKKIFGKSINDYKGKTKILIFHHIDSILRFRSIICHLNLYYNFISIEDYFTGNINYNKINLIISLDDGYSSWKKFAFPVFKEFKIKPLLFINCDFVGLSNNESKTYCKKYIGTWAEKAIQWNEIKDFINLGATIGTHGIKHQNIHRLSSIEIQKLIKKESEIYFKMLGTKPIYHAFTNGLWSDKALIELRKLGFSHVFSTESDFLPLKKETFLLPRVNIGMRSKRSACGHVEGYDKLIFNQVQKLKKLFCKKH